MTKARQLRPMRRIQDLFAISDKAAFTIRG
jgi:hypothetical protein